MASYDAGSNEDQRRRMDGARSSSSERYVDPLADLRREQADRWRSSPADRAADSPQPTKSRILTSVVIVMMVYAIAIYREFRHSESQGGKPASADRTANAQPSVVQVPSLPSSGQEQSTTGPVELSSGELSQSDVEAIRTLGDASIQLELDRLITRHGVNYRMFASGTTLKERARSLILEVSPDEYRVFQRDPVLNGNFSSALHLTGIAQTEALWLVRKAARAQLSLPNGRR